MYFYNTELGYTIVGAWGLRKLISTYSGPIVRIRDTVGNAEQDVYANSTTGELNSYTVSGNAAIVKVYDQSGNGADLGQPTTTLQPLLILNATGNGKPAARFDGVDDFLRDATASTTRPYLVAAPLHVSMSAPRQPREQWGKVWCIPHNDGANSSPYSRLVHEQDAATTLNWEAATRYDSVQPGTLLQARGYNNRKGFNAHALLGYLGKFILAGMPSQSFTADTSVTYPNSTRLYISANGQNTENNGMDWVEHVVYSTTSPVEVDVQALVDKVAYERLFGPNRLFKMVVTGTFSPSQYDGGCASMELRDSVGGADVTDQYTPMIANKRFNGTESWEKIFDDNDSTYYSSGDSPATTTPILYFTKETNNKLAQLVYKARGDSFYPYTFKKYHIYRFTQSGWEDSAGGEIDNTSAGNSAAQVYSNSLTWTDPTVSDTWGFDYKITAHAYGSWPFDYKVEAGNQIAWHHDFDYEIFAPVSVTWSFDYKVQLYTVRTFDYKVLGDTGNYLRYFAINGGSQDKHPARAFSVATGQTIGEQGAANPGALHYVEPVVLPDQESPLHQNFYSDFYERIWVSPLDYRLSNPKLGYEYPFYVWSAYDRPNALVDYLPTDVDGIEFTEEGDMPISFKPVEQKILHFSVLPTAPAQIEGRLDFDFTMGGDGFNLFVLVLSVLRTLPNEPMREIWAWYTTIETSKNGMEQRMAMRDEPRTMVDYDVVITDDEDRISAYQQLYAFASRPILVPMFQYVTPLDAPVEEGDDRIYFEIEKSDIRAGEYIVLFNRFTLQFVLVQVSTLEADGVSLVTPIEIDAGIDEWEVLPGRSMRLPNKSSLDMEAVDGGASVRGESVVWRALVRPGSAVTLVTLDDYPILSLRPIADPNIDETFDQDVELLDNDYSTPVQKSTYTNPFVESTKSWEIDREIDMDWWRTFMDYCKGQQKPFLMPTWRNDLPLYEQPELGDTVLLSTNTDFLDYFEHDTYGWVMIQSDAGVIFRRVEEVIPDVAGVAISINEGIGVSAGSNENMVVSFCNLTRLNSDEVTFDHFVNYTIVTLDTRTVNQ